MFIKTVPQGHCVIIERYGKPVRVVNSGLNFFIPFLDVAKNVSTVWGEETNKEGIFIELTEQLRDTGPRDCFTKDNVQLNVNCAFRWRIVDPLKAVYEVDKLHTSIKEAVLGEVRAFVGQNELNTILSSRSKISDHVISVVSETVRRWGVNLTGVEIQELQADENAKAAMLQQMEASRKAIAIKLEAEGKAVAIVQEAEASKKAALLKAESQRDAMRLIAEAEKNYLEALSEKVGYKSAAEILIAQKTLEAYHLIAQGPANKVFVPMAALSKAIYGESVTMDAKKGA